MRRYSGTKDNRVHYLVSLAIFFGVLAITLYLKYRGWNMWFNKKLADLIMAFLLLFVGLYALRLRRDIETLLNILLRLVDKK